MCHDMGAHATSKAVRMVASTAKQEISSSSPASSPTLGDDLNVDAASSVDASQDLPGPGDTQVEAHQEQHTQPTPARTDDAPGIHAI